MIHDLISILKDSNIYLTLWHAATLFAPIWMPLVFILAWWNLWLEYKRREHIKAQGSVLLEIKLPREMMKSPLAMEMFLNNLYQSSPGSSLLKVYYEGTLRPWFSLELVSIEGTVHFYIWTQKRFKGLIETQLYAQFPEVEVHEAPDYSLAIQHDPSKINFGTFTQMALTKADAYPIKTYIEYGLDKDPKEEYKHDPIATVLEYLGSLRKGEQAWIQILIQAHAKEGLKYGRIVTKPDWKAAAEKEMEDIKKKATPGADGDTMKLSMLSKGQQDVVSAIERSLSKFAFDTMIRVTYFAEKDAFNPGNIGGLLGSFRQFSSNSLNGFKPNFPSYDYPWQDFKNRKKYKNERNLLEAYKRRSFFNTPFKNFKGKPFILTTEELATIFHFPSSESVATPTLTRIPSKKAEAPSNLPI